ncbi:MAG: Uma2 family endonuclease [Terracidiphilus sp.]
MNWAIQDVALPARLLPPAPMSDEELIAFSEANKPCRVERLAFSQNCEILVKAPSGFENNRREAYVVHELFAWAETDGRGVAFSSNAGFNLPDGSTLSPDAGWVERNRLEALSEEERERYLPFAPDFVVEILSPSDSLAVLDAKMGQWIVNGARLGWRIDPYGGTVAIYSADGAPVVLERPEAVDGAGAVAGFQLKMAPIWGGR